MKKEWFHALSKNGQRIRLAAIRAEKSYMKAAAAWQKIAKKEMSR